MTRTLQAYLLARLEREPESRAVAFLNERGDHTWQTFGSVLAQAAGQAAMLADAGLKRGGVCVIVLTNGETSARLVTACLLMGAVPLLIAPPSLQTEGAFSSLGRIIEGIVRKTRPAVIVVDDALAAGAEAFEVPAGHARPVVMAHGRLESRTGDPTVFAAVGETDIAGMQLTSGTTGFPKVCVWQQDRVIAALEGMAAAMGLNQQDLLLNWTPLYHDMGLVNNFFLCMALGLPLALMKPTDFVRNPALWLRSLSALKATTTWSPNFGFALATQRCKVEDLAGVDLSHVRGFWNAAERIHYDTMIGFHERFKPLGVRFESLKTNFGCAENVGGATFSDPNGRFVYERVDSAAFLAQRVATLAAEGDQSRAVMVVSAGKGHPTLKVKILDDDGAVLPDGAIGEIALDSPSRMLGYLDDPEATSHALSGDLLRTGDLGYLRGGEVFWVGRVQERINVRGVKMDPSDLEPILFSVKGLRPGCFAAFGLDDAAAGTQRIVIVAERRESWPGGSTELAEEIRSQVFLALGVSVDEVLFVREGTLTKTSSGKRRHRFIKDLYVGGRLAEHLSPPDAAAAERPQTSGA